MTVTITVIKTAWANPENGPDNIFYQSSAYFTEGRTNLHGEEIDPSGPIGSRRGTVQVFLRRPLVIFQRRGGGGGGSRHYTTLWIRT